MSFKIGNWKLAILAFIFFSLFTGLGVWQLMRAKQKEILLKSFQERTKHAEFSAQDLNHPQDWRFYRVKLEGRFDQNHTVLLDNKTFHGKVGYEVYTPFKVDGLQIFILVDRGFIPLGSNRNNLPAISTTDKKVSINGMLNLPPNYVSLGDMKASNTISWPFVIEYINIGELANLLKLPLFPYVLTLSPDDQAAYAIEWHAMTMGPERNQGYAVQWFALALTLLILFVALNRKRKKPEVS